MDNPVVKHQAPHLGEKVIPKAEEDRERSEQENFGKMFISYSQEKKNN